MGGGERKGEEDEAERKERKRRGRREEEEMRGARVKKARQPKTYPLAVPVVTIPHLQLNPVESRGNIRSP